MQIEVITSGALGRAEAVLCRGFPQRPPGFWNRVLKALDAYRATRGAGPIGTLLVDKGEDVGVLLTLDSPAAPAGGRKLNLSSWYVDQRARFWAPLMLKAAVQAGELVTDLSPTRDVEAVNERLGVAGRVRGSMIVPTPFDSFLRSPARLVRQPGDDMAQLLADHAAMGLICATLSDDAGAMPLIFLPTRLRGLPGARLIYCPSLGRLRRHRGAVARFLLGRGRMFLEIEANRADAWPGALHAPSRCRVFAKGELPADAIDHSYTELTFIHQAIPGTP